jgi:hypothetical protein
MGLPYVNVKEGGIKHLALIKPKDFVELFAQLPFYQSQS